MSKSNYPYWSADAIDPNWHALDIKEIKLTPQTDR